MLILGIASIFLCGVLLGFVAGARNYVIEWLDS
jgi:hypothetical protein